MGSALRFAEEKGIEQHCCLEIEDDLSDMTLEVNLTIFLQRILPKMYYEACDLFW